MVIETEYNKVEGLFESNKVFMEKDCSKLRKSY